VIVLDTNVVSALMRAEPDPIVVTWLDRLPPEFLWTTSITVFEIRLGLELLAAGRRRRQLEEAFALTLEEDFEIGSCPSTRPRPKPPAASPPSAGAPAVPSRSAMSRSPASSACARRPSRLATPATSRDAEWCSSTLGRRECTRSPPAVL
jgi:hypothetical protein